MGHAGKVLSEGCGALRKIVLKLFNSRLEAFRRTFKGGPIHPPKGLSADRSLHSTKGL